MEPLLFEFLVCFGLENVSSTYTLSDKSQPNCGKKHVSYNEMTSNILPKITANQSKTKTQIKRICPTLLHEKKNDSVNTNILS
jgi:hypothetical protein